MDKNLTKLIERYQRSFAPGGITWLNELSPKKSRWLKSLISIVALRSYIRCLKEAEFKSEK